jgi:hypothetical protein
MTEETMGNRKSDSDTVYKYLGFDVYPGKVGEFWKSDDEKKQFIRHVKARGGQISVLDRDTALLNIKSMTLIDKAISIVGGALLILAFFLPVYSIDPSGRGISGSGISFFLNLPFIGSYAAWGGIVMILTLIVFSLLLLSCPVAGVLNILGVLNKNKGDKYLETVKKFNRFTYIPILLYAVLFIILILGAPHPFGSLGISGIGESLNLLAIFTLTGIGFWLNIIGLILGFAQARGI